MTNVQSVSYKVGRERQLDPYSASTGTIVARYPNGYTTPNATLVTGNHVRIKNLTSNNIVYEGVISSVDVDYGIPYVGGVGQADFVTISFEGSFAQYGRTQGNNYAMTSTNLEAQLLLGNGVSGLNAHTDSPGSPTMAATTISSSWGDWINKILVTINGRLQDSYSPGSLQLLTAFKKLTATVNFSDTTNNATNQVYDAVQFSSYGDNYYTQVTVAPESYSSATVQTGTIPYRTLLMNTLSPSTAQATDYANYLLGNYKTKNFAIASVSCLSEAQNTFKLDNLLGFADLASSYPGTTVTVTFRGTTYNCVIEGYSLSATPASSRYTFYLSGADLNAYLLLDNAVYGKLDSNKLGY